MQGGTTSTRGNDSTAYPRRPVVLWLEHSPGKWKMWIQIPSGRKKDMNPCLPHLKQVLLDVVAQLLHVGHSPVHQVLKQTEVK